MIGPDAQSDRRCASASITLTSNVARCPASLPTTRARLPATRRSTLEALEIEVDRGPPPAGGRVGQHVQDVLGTSRDGGLCGPGAHGRALSPRPARRVVVPAGDCRRPPGRSSRRPRGRAVVPQTTSAVLRCGRCVVPGCGATFDMSSARVRAWQAIPPDRQDMLLAARPARGRQARGVARHQVPGSRPGDRRRRDLRLRARSRCAAATRWPPSRSSAARRCSSRRSAASRSTPATRWSSSAVIVVYSLGAYTEGRTLWLGIALQCALFVVGALLVQLGSDRAGDAFFGVVMGCALPVAAGIAMRGRRRLVGRAAPALAAARRRARGRGRAAPWRPSARGSPASCTTSSATTSR